MLSSSFSRNDRRSHDSPVVRALTLRRMTFAEQAALILERFDLDEDVANELNARAFAVDEAIATPSNGEAAGSAAAHFMVFLVDTLRPWMGSPTSQDALATFAEFADQVHAEDEKKLDAFRSAMDDHEAGE